MQTSCGGSGENSNDDFGQALLIVSPLEKIIIQQ